MPGCRENTCTACLRCGLSRAHLNFVTRQTPFRTCDIYAVCLRCEFCCAVRGCWTLRIVCCKQYTQEVSLRNDFVCVLPARSCLDNIFHILCTCTCSYVCSCGRAGSCPMKNASRIGYNNTTVRRRHSLCDMSQVLVT